MIAVEVEDEAWTRDLADAQGVAMLAAQMAKLNLHNGDDGRIAEEIDILLTSDEEVRRLNARFRGKDEATNVLSFPAPRTSTLHLGDIALAHGVCAREAAAQGKTLADHLSHLVVHGVLHLLGHDHAADREAEEMEAMERAILSRLGVDDPYRCEPADVGP